MAGQQVKKNSKRPRSETHAGRKRGSAIKTNNRGGPRTKLDPLTLVLMGKGQYKTWKPKLDR